MSIKFSYVSPDNKNRVELEVDEDASYDELKQYFNDFISAVYTVSTDRITHRQYKNTEEKLIKCEDKDCCDCYNCASNDCSDCNNCTDNHECDNDPCTDCSCDNCGKTTCQDCCNDIDNCGDCGYSNHFGTNTKDELEIISQLNECLQCPENKNGECTYIKKHGKCKFIYE